MTPGAFYDTYIDHGHILITMVVAFATVVSVVYGVRYRVAYETASAAATELRLALTDAHAREEQLHVALDKALRELAQAEKAVERYQQMPNLERVVKAMTDASDKHESRAMERHHLLMAALERVITALSTIE